MKIYLKKWDVDDPDTKGKLIWQEIQTKYCDKELITNVDGTNKYSKFFMTNPVSVSDLNAYGSRLKCIDDQDLRSLTMYGNYQTNIASNLMVVLEKCDRDKRKDCKSDE